MTFRYFADRPDGSTVEFATVDHRGGKAGTYGWHAEANQWIPVTRKVRFSDHPSRHDCDARCMYARGRTMNCECSCGGKNHGKGNWNCEGTQ